ncbi:MAG: uL15 family ribosomal protein [Methanosarcinaceae archaeon]|nr:50S ribosomal protein L15 [Methanosarcinaceae archaeon]MDF1534106.1 uL15 family ribosomal protein [Methanosarcinaceae archaeon]
MSKTKTKKFRGSRTCGGGTTKNRRGAGNRGGRGRAGGCKHHNVRAMQLGYAYGKHGFKRPLKMLHDVSVVNVGELDELTEQLVNEGFAQLENGVYSIHLEVLDIEKVLGTGKVTKSLAITASEFSASARDKIEGAGGSCIKIEE